MFNTIILSPSLKLLKEVENFIAKLGIVPMQFTACDLARKDGALPKVSLFNVECESAIFMVHDLKSCHPHANIIYIGYKTSVEEIISLYRAGISDCLIHPICFNDLVGAFERMRITKALVNQFNLGEKLSQRELEVYGLLVDGLMNKDIASKLNVTPATIKAHKSKIMKKLNASSLQDLVRLSLQ